MQSIPSAGPLDLTVKLRSIVKRTAGSPEVKLKAALRFAMTSDLNLWDVRQCLRSAAKSAFIRNRVDAMGLPQGSNVEVEYLDNGATDIEVGPTLWSLVNDDLSWNKLVREVKRRIERSPSREEMRSAMVRQLFARVLLPWPEGAAPLLAKSVHGHAAFAVIAMQLITDAEERIKASVSETVRAHAAVIMALNDDEREAAEAALARAKRDVVWDTTIVTANGLATKLGWTPKTAESHLTLLRELRFIRKTNETGPGRYRLTELEEFEIDAVDDAYGSSIEAYLAGRPTALANLLTSVAHSAFTYGADLNHKHWLHLVAGAAQIPVSQFKMNRRIELLVKKTLDELELAPAIARFPLFNETLDRIAGIRGTDGFTSWERHAAGVAAGAERAAASIERITKNRDVKKRSYSAIDKLLEKYPIPDRPNIGRRSEKEEKLKRFRQWKGQIRAEFEGRTLPPQFAAIAESSLKARLGQRGYDSQGGREDITYELTHEILYGEQPDAVA
jgi:hypothetical protein